MILEPDVLIEILRSNMQTSRWEAVQASAGETLRYSPVSRAEIGAGVRRGEEDTIESFFGGLDALTVDATTRYLAGGCMRRYRPSHAIELGDALIGAAAPQPSPNQVGIAEPRKARRGVRIGRLQERHMG